MKASPSFQVGFLYLRYVGPPKTLWQWLAPYVKDDEVMHDFLLVCHILSLRLLDTARYISVS